MFSTFRDICCVWQELLLPIFTNYSRRNYNMASRREFIQYIADQLSGAGNITYRKMFGEYGIYCDGKIFGVICDDQLFVKVTEAGKRLGPDLETAAPYEGSKPYFLVENVDDQGYLTRLVTGTCQELPAPKPKKPKAVKDAKTAGTAKADRDAKTAGTAKTDRDAKTAGTAKIGKDTKKARTGKPAQSPDNPSSESI